MSSLPSNSSAIRPFEDFEPAAPVRSSSRDPLSARALARMTMELEATDAQEEVAASLNWFRVSTPGRAAVVVTGMNWLSAFGASLELFELELPDRMTTDVLRNKKILIRDLDARRSFVIRPTVAPEIEDTRTLIAEDLEGDEPDSWLDLDDEPVGLDREGVHFIPWARPG